MIDPGVSIVYLGLGSNLGDRQGNILQALQRLRSAATVEAVSEYYEGPPALGARGPSFLNVAVRLRTELQPRALKVFFEAVERAVGRRHSVPLGARPIDIDLLLIDGLHGKFGDFDVPHPHLAARPFNLIPLADIAPDVVEPRSGERIAALAARVPRDGITRVARSLHFAANRQEDPPDVRLSIDRVGVTDVKRLVRSRFEGRETVFNAAFTMAADLGPDKAGVHMSRFSELLEEATLDVLADDDGSGEVADVASAIAQRIVASQRATRADVRLRAEFALERWTPVSGKRGEESYTLIAIAHAERDRTRHVLGIEAAGMTACPCAQGMMREHSQRELCDAGFSAAQASRALDVLPVATHNQRGRGTLLLGLPGDGEKLIRAADLVEIVENAMSSETYDLLKRPDEFFVVNKAHRNPKFVEDVVRGMLAGALDMYADFPAEAFVLAHHVNYESIHKHDAVAEASGTFGELRADLETGLATARRTDLAGWLGTRNLGWL